MTEVNHTTKRCSRCGETKPLTVEFWHVRSSKKGTFSVWCKVCNSAYHRTPEAKARNRERQQSAEYKAKRYTREQREDVKLRQQAAAHSPQRKAYLKGYLQRDYVKERRQAAAQTPEAKAYQKQYRSTPEARARARLRANSPEYIQKAHIQRTSAYGRARSRIEASRRRARIRSLPNTFTVHHWQLCLEYWKETCAICNYPLKDVFGEISHNADHWIPMADKRTDNPGTVPENMICLCDSCNSSKNDADPVVWLEKRYGKRKASAIIQRIETYFDWIKKQD